jgi:hypothetical protein
MIRKYFIPAPLRLKTVSPQNLCASMQDMLTAGRETADSPEIDGGVGLRSVEKAAEGVSSSALAELSTHLWRMGKRLIDPQSGRPYEETRKIFRHYEASMDTLKKAGIEILDHTGDAFDAGLSIQVLTYQPTDGLDRDRVIETVRPTVYLHDQRIQMGVVIVGTPIEQEK